MPPMKIAGGEKQKAEKSRKQAGERSRVIQEFSEFSEISEIFAECKCKKNGTIS